MTDPIEFSTQWSYYCFHINKGNIRKFIFCGNVAQIPKYRIFGRYAHFLLSIDCDKGFRYHCCPTSYGFRVKLLPIGSPFWLSVPCLALYFYNCSRFSYIFFFKFSFVFHSCCYFVCGVYKLINKYFPSIFEYFIVFFGR